MTWLKKCLRVCVDIHNQSTRNTTNTASYLCIWQYHKPTAIKFLKAKHFTWTWKTAWSLYKYPEEKQSIPQSSRYKHWIQTIIMKIGLWIGKQRGVLISSADSASAFHKLTKSRKIGQKKHFWERHSQDFQEYLQILTIKRLLFPISKLSHYIK